MQTLRKLPINAPKPAAVVYQKMSAVIRRYCSYPGIRKDNAVYVFTLGPLCIGLHD
jgi:hypothetical protein